MEEYSRSERKTQNFDGVKLILNLTQGNLVEKMNGSVHENATNASFLTAIVTCAFNVPLMLTAIISNSFVLAAIFTTSSLRSPSIILLPYLAVSDVAVGLIAQPLYIARLFSSADLLMRVGDTMGSVFCGIALSTMALISVDRFLALQYHMTHDNLVTTSRVFFLIIIIWLFQVLISTLRWHLKRRKSSAKRKFYREHRSFHKEKGVLWKT